MSSSAGAGKLLALYAFDEQLVGTLRRLRGGDEEAEASSKAPTAEEVLEESGKLWPYVLKLLGDATASGGSAMERRFLVCVADRLVLSVRSIPIKLQERYIRDLSARVAEIEVNQERTLNAEVEKEKLKFFSTYAAIESELHKATDYWSIWEKEVRASIQARIFQTITDLKTALNQGNKELEVRDSRQAALRDRWADVRSRLLLTSTPWWGSLRPQNAVDEVPDWLTVSSLLPLDEFKVFASALARVQLLASIKTIEASPVWEAVRMSLNSLVSLAQRFLEHGNREAVEADTILTPLFNTIDALLFLLFVRASEDSQDSASRAKNELLATEREISEISDKLRNPDALLHDLSLRDPVVMRFRADSRTPLVDAALAHVLEVHKRRLVDLLDAKRNLFVTKGEEIRNFDQNKHKNFLEPWSLLWSSWKRLIGSCPELVGLEKLLNVSTEWTQINPPASSSPPPKLTAAMAINEYL